MDFKPGDKFTVTIGSKQVETTIDPDGVQRFPYNPIYGDLWDKRLIDLNAMAINYQSGRIKFEDYLDFYLNFGYSVCSFADLSSFQHLEIKNPLWEK